VAAAWCWWSRGRRKGEQQKGRARFGLIGDSTAQLMGEIGGGHGRSSRWRAAPACPRVRGSHSAPAMRRGKARGEQRRQHGRWEEDGVCVDGRRSAAEAREAAGGGGHVRAQRNRGDRGPEEDDGGSKRKFRKRQGPFYKT
jgi:hypothetical protein